MIGLLIFGLVLVTIVIAFFFYLAVLSYNIPVVVLRYTGNKGRPLMMIKKAKKVFRQGVPLLYVRGYKEPVGDFKSENYYPSIRGPYGGLILWEFEDNMLTPAIPKKMLKDLSPEDKSRLEAALVEVRNGLVVPFEFDDQLHKQLKLKAVDDVDVEAMLQEKKRIDSQYDGGWQAFLAKYASMMLIGMIAAFMLVGFIYGLSVLPELAATCSQASIQGMESTLIERGVDAVRPGG